MLKLTGFVGLALLAAVLPAAANETETAWGELRTSVIGERAVEDGTGFVVLEAPKRAEDAAIVPLGVRIVQAAGDTRRVKALTLVVDENPAPVVGTFRFAAAPAAFDLSTRVRVNSYSWVRAIAETEDGRLYMTKAYVKAAGGCSAPASKDPAEARANLGKMRFRTYADRGEAQVQIRHPNYSGLQMDQITRLYTPAWYVETVSVSQGDAPLFSMEGGISLSEDPTFRFSFPTRQAGPVTVVAKDTDGRIFRQTFPVADGS